MGTIVYRNVANGTNDRGIYRIFLSLPSVCLVISDSCVKQCWVQHRSLAKRSILSECVLLLLYGGEGNPKGCVEYCPWGNKTCIGGSPKSFGPLHYTLGIRSSGCFEMYFFFFALPSWHHRWPLNDILGEVRDYMSRHSGPYGTYASSDGECFDESTKFDTKHLECQ